MVGSCAWQVGKGDYKDLGMTTSICQLGSCLLEQHSFKQAILC